MNEIIETIILFILIIISFSGVIIYIGLVARRIYLEAIEKVSDLDEKYIKAFKKLQNENRKNASKDQDTFTERTHIADQLKEIIGKLIDECNLSPEDYFAITGAIDELKKNCGNCKFSSIVNYQGVMTTVCGKALQPLPEDYFGHFVELNLEVSQDHFCTFHVSIDENKESEPF